jgi:internalin A
VWDFGGQEIMHATHQFFLTKRSLYILVLDARAGEKESNIHYWLEMIRVYGENSPVIVVLNKSEQHYEQLDENRLKIDYEGAVNFVGFHEVSCKTSAGLAKLRSEIESAIRKMPHVSDYLPEDYFAVKEEMETRAARADFITEQEYAEACKNHGVYDPAEQIRLLRFLHDLGCVLHYDDPEQRYHVHDTRVLNPEWVTGGVYRVLNDVELLREGDGIVRRSDFRRLLNPNRYPQHRYPFLIEVMKKYELCIEFPDDAVKVLVPELLSKNEPDVGWALKNQGDVLEFQYHYSVLPRGLVPRFIVRTQHLLTEQPTVWRAGVVLSVEGCRVLVRGDTRLAKVFIQVQGPRGSRRRALAVVRDLFAAVHLSYGDLNAEAKVPLPGDPGAPPVDYRHLVKLERQSIAEYWFEKAQRPYNVRELLDGIDERRFDVFLSHNSIDKPAVRELAKRLQAYGVRYWLDEEHLTPGETWQQELASAIRECRTIIILVGAQGVGPWEAEESAIGLDHAARGKKRVIPVLLPRAPKLSELPAQFDFLASRTWIEFKEEFSEVIVSRLARAIMEH